jgi:hypothetical protein
MELRIIEQQIPQGIVNYVDAYELNSFVNNVYGFSSNTHGVDSTGQRFFSNGFEFQADQLLGNDDEKYFNVEAKEHVNDAQWTRFIERNGMCEGMAPIVLNDLCYQGLIPAGEYLVSV